MNKLYGTIIGLLLGIISAVIWIYRDTIIHPGCSSLWRCSSSALFKFGILKFTIIIAIAVGILGFLMGMIFDKKAKNDK